MKIIYYSIILSNICEILASTKLSKHHIQYCKWVDSLTPKIIDILYTHHQAIIFLFNNQKLSVQYNVVIEGILQRYPLMVVNTADIENIKSLIARKTLNTYIILSHITNNNEGKFKDFISRLNYLLKNVQPKCLVINFNYNSIPRKLQDIMNNAWQNKYLDFTFIHVNLKENCSNPTIHYYNPFIKKGYQNVLSQNTELFPDKLIDTKGFKIHARNCENVTRDRFGDLSSNTHKDKHTIPLLSIALKKLNMSLNFEKKEIPLEGKINMVTLTRFQIAITQEDAPQIRIHETCTQIKAIVPIIYKRKMNVPYEILIHMSVFIITGIFGSCIKKVLHDNSEYWSTLNIVMQLLGGSSQIDPHTMIERILTVYFGFIGMYYSGEIYSSIVGTLLLRDALPFDSFQKIYESGYTIEVSYARYLANHKQYIMDRYLDKIVYSWKTIREENLPKCFDLLYTEGNVICLADEAMIRNFFSDNPKYLTAMKVAPPIFGCLRFAFMLDMRSVFAAKLQNIVDRITETGIAEHYKTMGTNRNVRSYDIDETVRIGDIMPILFVGYTISSLILLTEITSGCINQIRNLFVFL